MDEQQKTNAPTTQAEALKMIRALDPALSTDFTSYDKNIAWRRLNEFIKALLPA